MLSSLVSPILSKLATFSIFLGFTMEVKHIQLNREKQTAGNDVRRTSRLSDCQSTFQNYFASSDPHHDISKQLVDTTFV